MKEKKMSTYKSIYKSLHNLKRISSKNEEEKNNHTFSNKQKLKDLIPSVSNLQVMLVEVL